MVSLQKITRSTLKMDLGKSYPKMPLEMACFGCFEGLDRVAQMLFLLFDQRNKGLVPYNLLIQNKTHQTAIEKKMIEQPMNL